MIGTFLTVAGWLLALAFTAAVLSSASRTVRGYFTRPRVLHGWTTPLLYAVPAAAALTGLGVLGLLQGIIITVLLAAGYCVTVLASRKRLSAGPVTIARADAISGFTWLRRDVTRITARIRSTADRDATQPVPVTQAAPQPSPAQQPARQTPAAPAPVAPQPVQPPAAAPPAGGITAAMPGILSPGWAALCAEIDEFEGETDEGVLAFFAGQLAGHMAHAESVRNMADRFLHGTGLDPVFVQGVAEYADENADMTGAVTILDRQFHAIYDALRAWADEHPLGMPHEARKFLQGGDTEPEAGDDAEAA